MIFSLGNLLLSFQATYKRNNSLSLRSWRDLGRSAVLFGGGAARRVGIPVNLKSHLPQFLGISNSPQPGLREFLIR